MANVKNFGLVGVGTTVQFGKAGPSLGQQTATVLKADGTAAFRLPSGSAAQQPTASAAGSGAMRFNSDGGYMEFSNGTAWTSLATGGAAVTSVNGTANRITSSNTGAGSTTIDIASTYVGQTSITTLGTVTTGTWNGTVVSPTYGGTGVNNGSNTLTLGGNLTTSGAFNSTFTMTGATNVTFPTSGTLLSTDTIAANAVTSFQTSLSGLSPSTATNGVVTLSGTLGSTSGGTGLSTFASGSVLYASGANTWAAALPGSTSGVQAWDADLDALAGQTGTGYLIRTGSGTATTRSITGTSGNIVVTNGDGVASDTNVDLATVTQANTGNFVKVTLDGFGRVTGNTAVVTADITALVDSTYVNVSGDSMSSGANLTFVGGGEVLGLPSTPSGDTAATSKAYVDSVAAGLSWKQAVVAATTGNITLSGAQTIDGVSVVAGNRVLVRAQTSAADNGIYVAAAGAWTRATDADTPSELDGAAVFVQQGTTLADTGWTQTATIVTVGTTPQTWVQFSGANAYIAGSGLDLAGNVFSVNVGAGITILPTDEVGIDVEAGKAVQLTGSLTSSQLTFVLDGGNVVSGLEQSASGLKISANGVTNAMLANSTITFNTDENDPDTVSLGETLQIIGTSTQGISTNGPSNNVIQITAADASSSQKGVASFTTGEFVVTAGNVALGTVPVAKGGTGATTLLDTAILIGNGTSPVEATNNLTYDSTTETMTIGGTNGVSIDALTGGDVTITALGTDADINLNPNGTGQVVVGPAGNGTISSDSGASLTVTGDTALTLTSTAGDVTIDSADDLLIDLPNTTTAKVTLTTVTAANYATGLSDSDLVNKLYVDQAISTGGTGDVKAVQATVDLSLGSAQNIGAALPAGSTVLSVKVNVTSAAATGSLEVGKSGDTNAYMEDTEVDTQTTGLYLAETMVTEGSSTQVIATVTGTPAAGSATVVVTYKLA